MNKNIPIYLYGAIIILEGLFLLFSTDITFHIIKYALGIGLIVGAIIAFSEALSRQRKHVEFSYHEIHALTMMVYGIFVMFFANSLETLVQLSSFLFFFYAFSEIVFCFWVFNLGRALVYKIVLIRVLLGVTVGVGNIFIMSYYTTNQALAFEGFGVLFILIGINVLLFVPVMKAKELINK